MGIDNPDGLKLFKNSKANNCWSDYFSLVNIVDRPFIIIIIIVEAAVDVGKKKINKLTKRFEIKNL